MRIAVVTNILPPEGSGGAEAYAALVAATLAHAHDVLVISGSPTGDIGRAQLATVPSLAELHTDAPLSRKLVWHARDQWRPTVHRATSRALRTFDPDVVHSHAVQGLSAAVFTAIAGLGIPHVHTAHDLSLLCARVSMTKNSEFCGGGCATCRVQRAIRRRAFGLQPTRLLAVSDYIRRRHVEAGIVPAERAVVLRLGVEGNGARVRSLSGEGIHVGFIGGLAPHKGVRTLLHTFRDAPETWRLTIAGRGPLQDEVAAAAAASPRIAFLGHVSGAQKDAFFDAIDVLAIPSEWEEPAPLVGFEAAIRAVPCIVSDRGGVGELAEARVFRARNSIALREAIEWFLSEPSRLESVSRRLFDRRKEFAWDPHLELLSTILAESASEGAPDNPP